MKLPACACDRWRPRGCVRCADAKDREIGVWERSQALFSLKPFNREALGSSESESSVWESGISIFNAFL